MTQHMEVTSPHDATPPCVLASSSHPGGRMLATVLVVDDNEASIELARIMLVRRSQLKCILLYAGSGDEALATMRTMAAQGAQVDLVLLDINMPRLDGFEVLRELSADVSIPMPAVIMCSTSSSSKDLERAYALGASGYVEKPPQLENLRRVLDGAEGLTLEESAAGAFLLRAA
jgi:CheY-like chemotaxis protein